MLDELRQRLQALQKAPGIGDDPGILPLGIDAVDAALGGGLARGALHEIAALSEAHLAAATGFALGVAALPSPLPWGEGLRLIESHLPPHPPSLRSADLSPQGRGERKRSIFWIAEDMALAESGAPYGPGLDQFNLAPERLLTAGVAHRRDLLWAMEEALRCRAIGAVIGELRHGELDAVTVRRLSLAAADSGALALLLRSAPASDSSTAATRWIVGASPSSGGGGSPNEVRRGGVIYAKKFSPPPGVQAHADLPPPGGGEKEKFEFGAPHFAAHLIRNRRGPTGSWILEWSDTDERFVLAAPAQPVAAPARHRPHRQKVA